MPNDYKIFELDSDLPIYDCQIIVSDEYNENVVTVIEKGRSYIYINLHYVENAKREVIEKLLRFINHYHRSKIAILSSSLINDEILEALACNNRISMVTLGNPNDIYKLTRKDFEILDKSESIYFIETDSIEGNYSKEEKDRLGFYSTKKIVGDYTYNALNSSSFILFLYPLSEVEIKNLSKYLENKVEIEFLYDDAKNIIAVIEALKGRNIKFSIRQSAVVKNNLEAFKPFSEEDISIVQKVDFKRYLEVETILNLAIRDIKDSTLSPYEKYLAVFKIVKDFKSYCKQGLKYQYNTPASYNLYEILFSDFIVCSGFSELMVDLLKRVGIYATFLHIEILKENENLTLEDYASLTLKEQETKEGNKDYHSRIIFRLVDSKYDIDGIFVSDVTWDQEETKDLFNHSSLTPYETRFERDVFYNTPDDIFDIQSGTEFYTKLQKFPESISRFLEIIKIIDKPFYKYLENKYDIDGPYTTDFFIEVYNYIIMHTNKRISKGTLLKALKEVIKHTYSELSIEELNKIVDELSKSYDEEQAFSFLPNNEIRR